MQSGEMFSLAAFALLAGGSALLPAVGSFRNRDTVKTLFTALPRVAAILICAGMCLRWHSYAQAMNASWWASFPVSTFYESAVFFILLTVATAVFLEKSPLESPALSAVCLAGGIAILALNLSEIPTGEVMFLPSLKSGWLIVHVALSFVSYAMYAVAALLALLELLHLRKKGTAVIEMLISNATCVFTIGGLVFGAVWAHESWGRFWAWDPKETWALITWCAYVLQLHFCFGRRIGERGFCLWSIANFGIVLFTYFGVSLLFAGLHSYISF